MEIVTTYQGPVAILGLRGRLTHGQGDTALRGAVLDVLEDGYDKILIDMSRVTRVDSSGLGELLRTRSTCQSRRASIKLLRCNMKVYSLITMSKLVGVFEIFDDEADALPSYWQDAPTATAH